MIVEGQSRSSNTVFAVLSISSLTLPIASAGSSLTARRIRSRPSWIADGSRSCAREPIESWAPIAVIWLSLSST